MERRWPLVAVICLFGFGLLIPVAQGKNAEQELYNTLFNGYNPDIRPIHNTSNPIYIMADFFPIQLKEMNEREQSISFYAFLLMAWTDEFLTWDPANHSSVQMLIVDSKKVWAPSLGLLNSVEKYFDASTTEGIRTRVQYDGIIQHQLGGVFTATCQMNTRTFPFDNHDCELQFTSTSFDSRYVQFVPMRSGPLLLDFYGQNGQWELTNSSCVPSALHPIGAGLDVYFSMLIFKFNLARKNMFHLLNMIVPLILTIMLVPMLFLLPADSGEKLGLGVTVLLALSVFLLSLSEMTPETSNYVPIMTIFVTIQLVVTSFSIIFSTLILRLHHKNSPKRPPRAMRTFFLGYLAKVLCLGDQRRETKEEEEEASWATKNTNIKNSLADLKEVEKKADELKGMSPGNRRLLEYMNIMVQKIKDDNEAGEISDEWKRIAYVIDWFCFWLFSIGIVTATATVFIQGTTAPS